MRIKCKINKIKSIDDSLIIEFLKKYMSLNDNEEFLELGEEFVVHGIEFWDNTPWYYIYKDSDAYPTPFYAGFFEIIDNSFSKFWNLNHSIEKYTYTSILFKEWAENKNLYEKLLEDDIGALAIFKRYRKLLESEDLINGT